MVPSEYRLERVAVALVERLDGERRGAGSREELAAAVAAAASNEVDARLAGWVDATSGYGRRHTEWLRRELGEVFVPRFSAAAWAITEAERDGFGMGRWASPWGRVALVVGSLGLLWFGLLRFERLPEIWPLTLLDLSVPFLPDLLSALHHRRYAATLRLLVEELERKQEAALAYSPAPEGPDTSPRRRGPRKPVMVREV